MLVGRKVDSEMQRSKYPAPGVFIEKKIPTEKINLVLFQRAANVILHPSFVYVKITSKFRC